MSKVMPISDKTKSIVGYIVATLAFNTELSFSVKTLNDMMVKDLVLCKGLPPSVTHTILAGGYEAELLDRTVDSSSRTLHYRSKSGDLRDDDLLAAYTLYNQVRSRRTKTDMKARVEALEVEETDSGGPVSLSDIISMVEDVEDHIIAIKEAVVELKERLA